MWILTLPQAVLGVFSSVPRDKGPCKHGESWIVMKYIFKNKDKILYHFQEWLNISIGWVWMENPYSHRWTIICLSITQMDGKLQVTFQNYF